MAYTDANCVTHMIPFRARATLTGTATAAIVASTAGVRVLVTKVVASNSGTSTNTKLQLFFGSDTTPFVKQIVYGGSALQSTFTDPPKIGGNGQGVVGSLSVAVTDVEVDIDGYVDRV